MTSTFGPTSDRWAAQATALLIEDRLGRIGEAFSGARVEGVLLYEPSIRARLGIGGASEGLGIAVGRWSARRARRALELEGWNLISFFRGGAAYWKDGLSLNLHWRLLPLKGTRAVRMLRLMRRLGATDTQNLIEPPIWLLGVLLAVGLEGAGLTRAQRRQVATTAIAVAEDPDKVRLAVRELKLSDEIDPLVNSDDHDDVRGDQGSAARFQRLGTFIRRMRLRIHDRPFHPFSCEFQGMRLYLDPFVFHPQPSAEKLAEIVTALLRNVESPTVVDVGTGSGAVALAVARAIPDSTVHAVDVDRPAVRCARRNRRRLRLDNVYVSRGHLLDPVAQLRGSIDVVAAVLPYLPRSVAATSGDLAPAVTLDGRSDDGLGLVVELAHSALRHLRPGGWLVVQVAESQWDQFVGELDRAGYGTSEVAVRWPGRVVVGMAQLPRAE